MRFPVWHKKQNDPSAARGISQCAIAGAREQELARAAVLFLRQASSVDRVGVWLECRNDFGGPRDAASFRGFVSDRQNPNTALEGTRLAAQFPVPVEALNAGTTVNVNLEALGGQTIIAPLIGMQRALWVPVIRDGVVRGMVLAANKNKSRKLIPGPCENVAAELSLALGYQDEKYRRQQLHGDLQLVPRVLGNLATPENCSNALDLLVKEAVSTENALAKFLLIGKIGEPRESSEALGEDFHWRSGEALWTTILRREPFLGLWRKAIAQRQIVDTNLPKSWYRGDVTRIIALPLQEGEELLGVLVAGLSRNKSFAVSERIQLRSALAVRLLAEMNRFERESRNEQRRQTMLLAGSEALLLLDSRLGIVDASSAALKLLGEKSDNSPSPPAHDQLLSRFRPQDHRQLQLWLENVRHDLSALPNKSIEAVLQSGVTVRVLAEHPHATEFIALRCEIVETAKPTSESVRAEQQLQVVLGWLEEGVVVFDAHENIRAMNQRFAQIAGIPIREAAALTTLDELIRKISPRVPEPMQFARNWVELSGMDGDVRDEMEIASPTPSLLERTSRTILDPAGRRAGRVEIYRDLTAKRLLHARLLQTEKLAEVGQRVSSVAHELSNPLTTILGYAQRLLTRIDSSPGASEIRQIFHEADRAGKILRQLLPSTRETKQLHRRNVPVNRVVLQTVEMQRSAGGWETIRTELDLDPLAPTVWGDAGQLQQVLINLLSNARHALAETAKGGLIRIRTRQGAGNIVTLEVTDNGPGIPEAIAARIFDPFFTTRPAGLGTGLGLSIVLGIIREHGGQISVTSPPGGGTRFCIELRSAPAISSQAQLSSIGSGEFNPFSGKPASRNTNGLRAHVLVVEDEPTVARLIADVLEDEGYKVDVMHSSREALERAGSAQYDLAICDMRMPGMDGQHFFQALLLAQNPLREKLLFVTGDGVAPATREFLERNKLPCVAKPFRVEELSEAVSKTLARTLRVPVQKNNSATKLGANNG